MADQKVATTSERLAKAGAEFKRLEKRITELETKYDALNTFLLKKHTSMIDIYQWYLQRLQEETDGLTKKGGQTK